MRLSDAIYLSRLAMSLRGLAVASLACLLLGGCSTLPKAIHRQAATPPCGGNHIFFVVDHGWHTGIVVEAADLNAVIPELRSRFGDADYYEVGSGDTGFYQAQEITMELALRAMFWSSGSVVHVVALHQHPASFFPNSDVRLARVDAEGYARLIEYIRSSFQLDEAGGVRQEQRGIYGDSQFFTGIGRYQMFNTCNKWTAKALRSGGYDVDPTLKLTASSVMRALEAACTQE